MDQQKHKLSCSPSFSAVCFVPEHIFSFFTMHYPLYRLRFSVADDSFSLQQAFPSHTCVRGTMRLSVPALSHHMPSASSLSISFICPCSLISTFCSHEGAEKDLVQGYKSYARRTSNHVGSGITLTQLSRRMIQSSIGYRQFLN
jgi:hypothetical protein